MRRVRTERLLLVASPGGPPVELAVATREVGVVDSQDELAVSPDGRYLAWTTPEDGRLHLRDPEGHDQILGRYGRKMRFSPDGNWLAAVTEVGRGDWQKLIVWELATGRIQPLLAASRVGRFEWARGGLVIAQDNGLVYAPLTGDRRDLFKAGAAESLERFTAASTSSRVTVVLRTDRSSDRGLQVRSLDLDHPDRIRELGTVPGTRVDNAEQSSDGDRVVLATPRGLYIIDGERPPRELSSRRDVHSLWFAPDGRLAYASPRGATVLDGRRARRLELREPISMVRFEHGSARVLVAAGRDVRAWDPAGDPQTVLASAQQGEQVLAAERYQGGVVLWTGREGPAPPHRIVRVLRGTGAGATTELERVEGERAADLARVIGSSFFMISADARTVAYRELSGTAFRVRAAGRTERAIAASRAVLSPGGGQILVARSDASRMAVWSLIDTATGRERTLFHTRQDDVARTPVAFSGDGTWLAVGREENRQPALLLFEIATDQQRTIPATTSTSWSWTARGLLVWGPRGLALVSPSGELQPVLDEPVEAGLARVTTNAVGAHVLVCFRDGTAGASVHPGLLRLALDAPSRPVELDVPNCWNRAVWLSPDGEQVVFSTRGMSSAGTYELHVRSARTGAPPRGLGEAYEDVVFDGRGRLAFVSHRGVNILDGKRDDVFDTDGPVEALHVTNGPSLVFAIGPEVIAWDPVKGTRTVVARAPEGQRILAAAATGDVVMLVTVE